jgi:exopolyphosphatase/guanosine-5'-triphosphate,3'-diphosphate pyrophosphatase
MEVFAHFCAASGLGPDEIDAVATSAIRDATNAREFLDRAEAARLRVRVLSDEEEARYGYLAAVNSTTLSDGVMLDIGGGSMQLVHVERRLARELDSWPLGAVRMTERFLPDDKPAKPSSCASCAVRAGALERAPWVRRRGRGSSASAARAQPRPPPPSASSASPSSACRASCSTRAALDASSRSSPSCRRPSAAACRASSRRADIILGGALVVQAVMERAASTAIDVTEAGLREGVFFERLPRRARRRALFDDVRRASVVNLAAQYGMAPTTTRTSRTSRASRSSSSTSSPRPAAPGRRVERELLWAAALLQASGMTIDYDDHHKHSR